MVGTEGITLQNIQAARQRIQDYIRKTPTFHCHRQRHPIDGEPDLYFKLECQQVTGSFKVRGALNKLLSMPEDQQHKPLFAASGGNHGLAVAYVGYIKNLPTKIFLPEQTSPAKIELIRDWGAEIVLAGKDIKEAIEAAHVEALSQEATYVHPFADPDIILGQGTLGLDVMEELPGLDTLIVAIGGGGLIGGVATAAKAINPNIKIIGVEPEAYPSMTKSLASGKVEVLGRTPTAAVTLAVRETSALNLQLAQNLVDETVLLTEDEIKQGTQWLWKEFSIAAEYSGAAALAALVCGKIKISEGEKACVIICGAGSDGIPG